MLLKSISCRSNSHREKRFQCGAPRDRIDPESESATKTHPLYLPTVDGDQTDAKRNGPTRQGRWSKSFDTRGAPSGLAGRRNDGDDCRRRLMMLESC